MTLFKTIKNKLLGISLPALNWYKMAAFVILFGAWTGFIHIRATNACELKHERQKTEQAEKKVEQVQDHVQERLPVIQKKEEDSAALKQEIKILKDRLKDAINENKNRKDPTCSLSGTELSRLRELIEQSKQAAK